LIEGRTVNACGDDRPIDLGDDVKRVLVLRRNYLGNRLEPILLVAWIDPLRGISNRKIDACFQTRDLLKDRYTVFFDGAGINGRLVDDDVARLEHGTDRAGCCDHRAQIRLPHLIDRRRHGDNVEIRFPHRRGIFCGKNP